MRNEHEFMLSDDDVDSEDEEMHGMKIIPDFDSF
jgi:hypothetical protein